MTKESYSVKELEARFNELDISRGRYRYHGSGVKKVRPHSYGGEKKRRVSFADESEEEEELRLLQTGIASYARHNSTHYSSKEILLQVPPSKEENESNRGGYPGEITTDGLRRIFSINGRKVEKTNMSLKAVHLRSSDDVSIAKESIEKPKRCDDISCSDQHVSVASGSNFATRVVVNCRRQYTVKLPTSNPNITISVRTGTDPKDDKEGELNPGNQHDEHARRTGVPLENRNELRLSRRSLQEPKNDSYLRNNNLQSELHGFIPSSINYMNQKVAKEPLKSSINAKRCKFTNASLSYFDNSDRNEAPEEHPCHKIAVYPLKGTFPAKKYNQLTRDLNCQEQKINRNAVTHGEPNYLPIQDTGIKLVETAPLKLVSLLRPLFELNKEKENTPMRRREDRLKRRATLAIMRTQENMRVWDGKDVTRDVFFELGRHGWMCGKQTGRFDYKKTLNLDAEINKLTGKSTSAILSLGNIQITF